MLKPMADRHMKDRSGRVTRIIVFQKLQNSQQPDPSNKGSIIERWSSLSFGRETHEVAPGSLVSTYRHPYLGRKQKAKRRQT
jgi:hypothetical protein